ncbi:MAG TPA: hypothetical protein VF755_14220 [Catenuloplanes sp.]|jgi:hypothetical protein
MSEVSTGSAPHLGDAPGWAARPWARRAIPIVRGGLVLVWVVWAVLGWWSAPRPVGVDQARDDITAGRVGSVFRAEAWNDPTLWGGRPDANLRDDGLLLVWTTPAGQIRYTAPDLDRRPAELVGVGGSGSGTRTEQLAAELDAARTRPGRTTADYGPAVAVSTVLGGGLLMIFLGFLLAGPPPRRGTRLFWFWMALVPFGLGVLAWLATEAPWSRRVRRWADQPDADLPAPRPRRSGLFGFIAMFAVSFAAGLLIVGLRALLGPGLVPG